MLRRRPPSDAAPADAGDTLPLIASPVPAPPAPQRPRAEPVRSTFADRLRAAGVHLLLSAAVAACVLALVLLAWYPPPMPRLLGVDAILAIMLAVDVVLGPTFTLIVFDRRKERLAWDLATIGLLQAAALAYGLYTVHQGRPAFVVLVKDRFEVVAPADLRRDDLAAARANPFARSDPLAPRWVSARLPAAADERTRILFEAVSSGRDVQHHPKLYASLAEDAPAAIDRALPIARLRALNPGRGADVDAAVAATGHDESSLRYLPLRGPAADGAVLMSVPDGRVVSLLALTPW
jgi:hypothetical protein